MKEKLKQRKTIEIFLVVIAVLIVCFWLHQHAPNIIKILESGNLSELDEYLNHYGTAGKYLLVLLQAVETISIVIPAMPVYICSGLKGVPHSGYYKNQISSLTTMEDIYRVAVAVRQFQLAEEDHGEHIACLEARKHFAWYLKVVPHSGYYKNQISSLTTMEDIYRVAKDVVRDLT